MVSTSPFLYVLNFGLGLSISRVTRARHCVHFQGRACVASRITSDKEEDFFSEGLKEQPS